ncbi:MAG: hypothetical protein AB7V22_11875 [Kiritimatiellia bacterium]
MKSFQQANARVWAAILVLAAMPGLVRAQGISLSVGNTVPVTDVFGRNLPGTAGDPDNSCRVEIRQTWTGGLILAPSNDPAQLEALNPLVTNTYLGSGVIGVRPGLYSETFTDRSVLATNRQYYARVFDRPPGPTPVYYADTLPFYPPATDPSVNPEFGPLKLLATGATDVDTDGDGIPDGAEGDLGLDPNSPDTDGDGYGDWFEAFWWDYLNPKEGDAALEIQLNSPEIPGAEPRTVSWWTIPVPGLTYQLQYRPDALDPTGFSNVWCGVATETYLANVVETLIQEDSPVQGFFRVVVP